MTSSEPVAYMLPVTHEVLGQTGWAFYSRSGDPEEYEPGEYEAHIASIAGAVPLYLHPSSAQPVQEMHELEVPDELVERVAKAICRLVPLHGSSAWIDPHGFDFPREYDQKERATIRYISRAAIIAALKGDQDGE